MSTERSTTLRVPKGSPPGRAAAGIKPALLAAAVVISLDTTAHAGDFEHRPQALHPNLLRPPPAEPDVSERARAERYRLYLKGDIRKRELKRDGRPTGRLGEARRGSNLRNQSRLNRARQELGRIERATRGGRSRRP